MLILKGFRYSENKFSLGYLVKVNICIPLHSHEHILPCFLDRLGYEIIHLWNILPVYIAKKQLIFGLGNGCYFSHLRQHLSKLFFAISFFLAVRFFVIFKSKVLFDNMKIMYFFMLSIQAKIYAGPSKSDFSRCWGYGWTFLSTVLIFAFW